MAERPDVAGIEGSGGGFIGGRDGLNVVLGARGGIGGAVARDSIVLKSLAIAGKTFPNVVAAVDRTGSASTMNVGVALLRRFRITVDYAQHALWLV